MTKSTVSDMINSLHKSTSFRKLQNPKSSCLHFQIWDDHVFTFPQDIRKMFGKHSKLYKPLHKHYKAHAWEYNCVMAIILPFCSCNRQPDVTANILRPLKIIRSYTLTFWLLQVTQFFSDFLILGLGTHLKKNYCHC